MTDPIARPGNDDEGVNNASDQVVDTWRQATEGKDPAATTEDFERMREGFADAATHDDFADAATREDQLAFADPDASHDAAHETAARSGPDA